MNTKHCRVVADDELAGRRLTKEEGAALLAETVRHLPEMTAQLRRERVAAKRRQREREAARIARGLPPISDDELAFDAECEAEWRAARCEPEQPGWRQPTEAERRDVLDEGRQGIRREEARGAVSRFVHRGLALGRGYYLRTTFPFRWWWRQRTHPHIAQHPGTASALWRLRDPPP